MIAGCGKAGRSSEHNAPFRREILCEARRFSVGTIGYPTGLQCDRGAESGGGRQQVDRHPQVAVKNSTDQKESIMAQDKRGFASMDEAKQREIASKGGHESGGNFKNDRERASEAGRKGGHESGGNFAHDRERAAEAGRKGGRS
jgi:general stress protein YciG